MSLDKAGKSEGYDDKMLMLSSQQMSQRSNQPKAGLERLLASDSSRRRSSGGQDPDLSNVMSNVTSTRLTTQMGHYEFLKHLSNSNKASVMGSAARSACTASVISGMRDDSTGHIDGSHQSIVMDQQFLEMKAKYILGLGGLLPQQASEVAADQSLHEPGQINKLQELYMQELEDSILPNALLLSATSNNNAQSTSEVPQVTQNSQPTPPVEAKEPFQKKQHQLEVYSNIVA